MVIEMMSCYVIDKHNCKKVIEQTINHNDINKVLFYLDESAEELDKLLWIWDVDFSKLIATKKIICCGKRSYDIFLKLKMDYDSQNIIVEDNINKYIKENNNVEILSSEHSISKIKKIIG